MIKNGRPYTCEGAFSVDAALITDRTQEEQNAVFRWIKENILPRKTPLPYCSSYGIKHILQRDIGVYLTNNEFKDAMLLCGFYPVEEGKLNWTYRISKKSPAFKYKKK